MTDFDQADRIGLWGNDVTASDNVSKYVELYQIAYFTSTLFILITISIPTVCCM